MQEITATERYMLNVPGNGSNPCFMQDPKMRLQKWGANLMTNSIAVENELRNMNRNINRDLVGTNQYAPLETLNAAPQTYDECVSFTDESRATMPAWELRDKEVTRWEYPLMNPQENVAYNFQNNLSTRILEKDHFINKNCK